MNKVLVLILSIGLVFGTLIGCERSIVEPAKYDPPEYLQNLVGQELTVSGTFIGLTSEGSLKVWADTYEFGIILVKLPDTNSTKLNLLFRDEVKVTGTLKLSGVYYIEAKAEDIIKQ